jgi:hypothetical protein
MTLLLAAMAAVLTAVAAVMAAMDRDGCRRWERLSVQSCWEMTAAAVVARKAVNPE